MSSLSQFRGHCAKLAKADHKPECPSLPANRPYFGMWSSVFDAAGTVEALRWNGPPPPAPTCDGCLTDADRALFAQMAGEIDDYLAPQVDLFGDVTPEPTPAMSGPSESAASAAGVRI